MYILLYHMYYNTLRILNKICLNFVHHKRHIILILYCFIESSKSTNRENDDKSSIKLSNKVQCKRTKHLSDRF